MFTKKLEEYVSKLLKCVLLWKSLNISAVRSKISGHCVNRNCNRNCKQELDIVRITNKNMRTIRKYILRLKTSLRDELRTCDELTAKTDQKPMKKMSFE